MRLRQRRSTTISVLSLACAVLFAMGAFFIGNTTKNAFAEGDAGRLITVYDRGEQTVFLSDAATIREALSQEGYELDPRDTVEPALDETLVATDYRVNIYRARPITVIDGSTRQRVMTPYQTTERIVADAGITLYPEDRTTLERSDDLLTDGAGLHLTIDRAVPLSLDLFGKMMTVRTQGVTVAELLQEKGIVLTDADRTSPALDAPIHEGSTVRIWREGKQTMTVEEMVAFSVERIEDADRPLGYKEVKTTGEKGQRSVTYEVEVRDGKVIARKEIASVVTKQPVRQIEVVGAKVKLTTAISADKAAIMTAAGVAAKDQEYAAYIINNENALWCAIRWQGSRGCGESYYVPFSGAEGSSQIGYGLCQATPGNKMASAGADWRTNVVTQMKWCHQYALGRYGSWEAAYLFKVRVGWW